MPKKEIKEYFIVLGVEEHRITAVVATLSDEKVTIIGNGESEFTEGENEVEAADIAISTAEKNIPEDLLIKKVVFGLPAFFLEQDKIKPEFLDRLKKISKELDLEPQGFIEYPQALAFYLEKKEESPPTLLLLSVGRNNLILSQVRVGKIERNIVVSRTAAFYSDFEKIMSNFSEELLPSKIIIYDEVKGPQLEELREELLRFPWHKHASFLHTPKIEILEENDVNTALVEAAAGSLIRELNIEEIRVEEKKEVPEEKKEKEEEETETFGFIKGIQESEGEKKPIIVEDNFTTPHLPNFSQKISEIRLPKISLPPILGNLSFASLPFFYIFIILVIAGAGFLLFWFYPKATINLIVYPASNSHQLPITFSTDAAKLQAGKDIILANALSEEASGDKTSATTGKNKVGDKSRGDVLIYNKTTAGKTFPKGTVLTNGTLKFTLDDDVTIASASDTGEGLTFGKTTAKTTAVEIGPEGNIAGGSIFAFKDFPQSSYYAKNNSALAGGTSREVSSVSKTDQDNLLTVLAQELETAAKQKIMQKISSDEKLLDDTVTKEITSKKFSKDINTEGKEVSLSLALKINALVFKQSDLTTLIKDDQIAPPPGFTLDNSKTNIQISQAKKGSSNDVTALANITSFFVPDLDKNNIKSKLTGKSYQEVSNILSTIPNIGGVEIIKDNSLPFFNNTLPWYGSNININIVSR